MSDFTTTEIDHRVGQAWKRFNIFRSELINKKYTINDRIRLFDSIVTPTLLYGCESWAPTKDNLMKITRCQRRMLRLLIGHGRRRVVHTSPSLSSTSSSSCSSSRSSSSSSVSTDFLEPWSDWISRVTREAEDRLQHCGISDWVTKYKRRKWTWCYRLATMDHTRWAHVVAGWQPDLFDAQRARQPGRPKTRWQDDIDAFLRSQEILNDWQHKRF